MAISSIKKKRVSKKSKLSWRKHAKVQDIEEFLEEQRAEERLGPPLSTISNDQLFVLDTKPQEEQISSRQKRKLRAVRPLKGFSALVPYNNVPDPIKKRNRVRSKEERKSELIKKKEQEYRQKGVLKAKEIVAIAERRLDEIKRENKEKRGDFGKDLWGDDKVFPIEKDEWIEQITKKHNLRGVGVSVKKAVKDAQKMKSPLPAVDIPHPGMSYNPSFKDHQDLLRIVAETESKVIKKEEHLTRVTRDMFRRVSEEKKNVEWVVEMSEGLPSKKEDLKVKIKQEVEIKKEDDDTDVKSINPPAKNKKKTLQQRRKQKEQLELERARRALKLEKKKIGDIHKLKVLQSNLEKIEKKQEKLRNLRKIRSERKKKEPKILGSTKFEDPGLEFQMGEDIVGNLRGLKKEGNLLNDRFKSMQKRNILAPSKRAHRKKGKVKKYTKPGHKDDWEKSVARANLNK